METKQETLVILSPGFPVNEGDTACMPPQQLFVKALKEIKPDLNIIVIAFQYPFSAGAYQWHGIKVLSIGGENKGRLPRLITWLEAWHILKKLNREYRITSLLSFWFGECAFIGNYFAKKHKLTHYTWMLGQDAKKGNKYFKWIKPKGDTLIALSDFLANEVKTNYRISPGTVIPVGIDTSLFSKTPTERDIDILGAGSLIPLKQYHLFVEAVADLKKDFPNIKAVICGKGPEMKKLQSLATAMNLQDNLSFTGELPPNEVLTLMQRSKVFLHTSNYEGYGAVLAEALYAGAHVVSFCKPMSESYKHHHVIENKDEIAIKISAILNNPDTDHNRVLTYTMQQSARNMTDLFARIIPDIPAKPWLKTDVPKRILIIRIQAIGDMVATLSYIQYLRKSLSESTTIDFLTLEEAAPIPRSVELFNKVYALTGEKSFKKQLLYTMLMLPKLLRQRYDVVIDMQNNEVSRLIRKIIRPTAWSAFDRFAAIPGGERYRLTIEAIGLGPNYADSNIAVKPVPGTTELLKQNGWNGKSDLVIINPAGAFETRNWPLLNYFEFTTLWLQQSPGTQFLIMGVGSMVEKANFLKVLMGDHLINLSKKTDLAQAFAIVNQAKFVLSEDSGLMHMAWTLGRPTLALFGGTRSDWARPLGRHTDFVDSSDLSCGNCMLETCIHGDNRCITRYTPKAIFIRANELLNSLREEELV